jgi:putative tricarboxylic transport membrane protein
MKKDDRHLAVQNRLLLCITAFLILIIIAVDSKAANPSADYPSRPLELVVFREPGSSQDMMARRISDIIQKEKILNQPVYVSNKQGSNGAVAFSYVLEKKGNPHVILLIATANLLCTPMLEKLPYSYKSFTPIVGMTVDGGVLVVRSDSPFKTIDDLINEARKRPKELIQGGGSLTGYQSLMGLSMQKVKGVQWNFVSFAGGDNEAILNVLGGHVHFTFANPSTVLDYAQTGKLRVLVTAAPKRFPEYKDVPTLEEKGLGKPVLSNRGIIGSSNMPDYAVKKLELVFRKVMENDRYKSYLKDWMMQSSVMSSQEFSKFLDEDNDRYAGLLSGLGLLKKK